MTPFPLRTIAALALAACTALPAAAYDSLVVFGDSLSDSGNNALAIGANAAQVIAGNTYVPAQPYGSGTYSNGPVWATSFAAALGVPFLPSNAPMGDGRTNFAYGGAVTGGTTGFPLDLRDQVGQFLATTGGVVSPNALYVVAGGGNNARAALTQVAMGGNPLAVAAATAAAFAADIGAIVDQLQDAGLVDIIVWNTPNLGLAPAVAAAGPLTAGFATSLAAAMNAQLALRLASESRVTTFDIFSFGTMVAESPASFGFVNVTDACGAMGGPDCATSLYYDGIHPTAAAHAAISRAVVAITPIPEPETYALMLAGLAALGWRARRRTARS